MIGHGLTTWTGEYHYRGRFGQPNYPDRKLAYMSSAHVNFRSSQRMNHNLDRRPGNFKCPKCGKAYRWLRNMKNHLKIECGMDPKECCPYCPHRTKYKSSLQKHIARIHLR
ncbi:longitudinals lacking protein, isoforms F/I/K/T-like [Cephus cinctus]|uniref:Longitudinals lacking protein, isoforms F/I/K/T-like n=1 Tax=Cephus cinctus TaxID=211228 RepID=A0AAJ7VXX8_CEPCN|nr:longitudinals lacking protein, isoforms F/I/K/T-like [Cephus cinctus]